LLISSIHPYDRITWVMEVAPVLLGLPILLFTYRKYPLTTLAYVLITLHALVLIGGGTYTYARVPFGYWLQELLGSERNPYDKIGHLMQGLVPTLLAREIFVRSRTISLPWLINLMALCVAMTISALYELIEWAAALMMGQGADEFLGLQGDQWDTQSDMFFAFLGALITWIFLTRWHDSQINKMQDSHEW
jgi:putative membrane protein